MSALIDIEGIGETYEAKLKAAGVTTQEKLLEAGSTPKGRKEVAEKTGISDALILKWVNHCDLARIKGVAGQYAELLEAAGVDTVPELATRKPENLVAKMVEVNAAKKLVRNLPVLKQVEDWVDQAKKLPRVVNY
jgi:predicted flap endonuclease-1-like 5' DNA nuclease